MTQEHSQWKGFIRLFQQEIFKFKLKKGNKTKSGLKC